jgi:DNA ligase 1
MSNQEGWEGIMLRKDIGYEGKRSKNLLKVKKFYDAEYEVVRLG